jgi:predicted nucleotidyltransferase component of viral defense system
MLYYKTIDSKTLELLKKILEVDIFKDLRLVGGTSLALQIGHRISVDLDFFGLLTADEISIRNALNQIGEINLLFKTENINIFTIDGIKVGIVNYPYPWLKDVIEEDHLRLAGKTDIAAMKLAAIVGRGTKKDFIDLFFLLKEYSLSELITYYEQKYHDGSVFMVLRSLAFFDDADDELMPKMFEHLNWERVKESIAENLKNYVGSN